MLDFFQKIQDLFPVVQVQAYSSLDVNNKKEKSLI